MVHELDTSKLLKTLIDLRNPSMTEKRNWKTPYRGKTCGYWNFLLWSCILDSELLTETPVQSEFNLDDQNCIVRVTTDRILSVMTSDEKTLNFDELETFLNIISQQHYDEIMDCLLTEEFLENDEDLSNFLTPMTEKESHDTRSMCPFYKWIFPSQYMRGLLFTSTMRK